MTTQLHKSVISSYKYLPPPISFLLLKIKKTPSSQSEEELTVSHIIHLKRKHSWRAFIRRLDPGGAGWTPVEGFILRIRYCTRKKSRDDMHWLGLPRPITSKQCFITVKSMNNCIADYISDSCF